MNEQMNVRMRSIVWLWLMLVPTVLSDRLLDKMYTSIDGSVCFRRLNGTHSTGCGSSHGGSVGALHLIEAKSDFEFVWNKPPAPPYTLIVPPSLFNRENILEVADKAKMNIAGIVLIENGTDLDNFSHELKCPNQYGGLKEQTCDASQPNTTWNPFGTGLLHENFPFPIVYVKDTEHVKSIVDCYNKFNRNDPENQNRRSLCSIQIKSFMSAALNSEVCMRRTKYMNNMNPQRYCDPLQSKNVYSTLFARPRENFTDEYIVIAARIDTTSMFDGVGVGAMDSAVPAITLMTAAHTLKQIFIKDTNSIQRNYNVLFMLFNGESYDYIGSQRFVYDLENNEFPMPTPQTNPIRLENIKLLIDIGSLDSPNSTTIYQFGKSNNPNQLANTFADAFGGVVQKYGFNFDVKRKTTENMPPTSAQSFLRDYPEFPALVFYSDNNKNRFYHSIYDNETNIGFVYRNTSKDFTALMDLMDSGDFSHSIQMAIRNVSSSLAFSLFELITGQKYTNNLGANLYLIDEMLHCYLQSAKCPLFDAVVRSSIAVQSIPPHRYVSVQNAVSYETVGWTYRVLGFATGHPEPAKFPYTKDNCTDWPLEWFVGFNKSGQCLYTSLNLSQAFSPAFLNDSYDWKSGRYSTWTESTWSEITIRIFLKPAVSHEAFTLAIGFTVMLVSFVLVFIVNSKSDVLFGESTSSINVLTLPAQC